MHLISQYKDNKITKRELKDLALEQKGRLPILSKGTRTITHRKRLDVRKEAITDFEIFLDKISPLKNSNKLGAILLQLPPSFTVNDFKNIEGFLDRLPSGYDYAVEFRHPSWKTEGPWDMLKHYNIAAVMTDSPAKENLEFLSEITVTSADHSFSFQTL